MQHKPGIYPGLSWDEYVAIDAVNNSRLAHGMLSMAHLRAAMEGSLVREDTPQMGFGRAYHCRVLEPEVFAAKFAVAPAGTNKDGTASQKTREGVAAWEAWNATNVGKEALSPAEYRGIEAMATSVRAHPGASRLLGLPGDNEVTVVWEDASGILCKCRIDRLTKDYEMCVDLKTTACASHDEFQRSADKYGYFRQAAMNLDAVHAITGVYGSFVMIAQEKEDPYAVAAYEADAESIDIGRTQYANLLQQLAECRTTGVWPGYSPRVESLSLPAYVLARAARFGEEAVI